MFMFKYEEPFCQHRHSQVIQVLLFVLSPGWLYGGRPRPVYVFLSLQSQKWTDKSPSTNAE